MPTNSPKVKRDQGRAFAIPVSLAAPVILAVTAGIFIYLTDAGSLPVPDFYGLAAQIIPILMIAFALEGRATDLLSDPQLKLYRLQLFLFLLGGEIFALIGASGVLRGDVRAAQFAEGMVVGSEGGSNVVAAFTTAGLVGGFAMLTVLALFWGPGWIFLSVGRETETETETAEELRQRLKVIESQLERPSE